MKFLAEIQAHDEIEDNIEKLYRCLLPEIHKRGRGSVTIEKKDKRLDIKIQAEDSVALRAIMNSMTQMLTIFENTGRLSGENGHG